MTRWQRPGTFDPLSLSFLVAVAMVTLCLATTVAMGCPEPCQCTQTYYVYCQKLGLTSQGALELVTSVPREALLLDLSSNSLDTLTSSLFTSLPNLEYLFLHDNQVEEVQSGAFQQQQQLRELRLDGNSLRHLEEGVFNLSQLTSLHLQHNALTSLTPRGLSLPRLLTLHVQHNALTELNSLHFTGMPALQELDVSDNRLASLGAGTFRELTSLRVLRLSRNNLTSLSPDAFEGLTSVRELHLDGNQLRSMEGVTSSGLGGSLQRLVMTDNRLASLPREALASLASLRALLLDGNRISSGGPQVFTGLRLDTLSLARNRLTTIDRSTLGGLRRASRLDLSDNRLTTVGTGALDAFRESLYVLNLSGNSLGSVDHGMLRGMTNLQTLDLSRNALGSLLDGALQDLGKLTELNLNRNSLQWLSAHLLRGPESLRELSVMHNPLQRLSGFTFDNVTWPVHVRVNMTVTTSTPTSLTVTWPYTQGSQLYWTLRVWCADDDTISSSSTASVVVDNTSSYTSSSSESAASRCSSSSSSTPLQQASLAPNEGSQRVEGLRPAQRYLLCVDPVFLSPLVHVTQCARGATSPLSPSTAPQPQDPSGHAASRGSSMESGGVWRGTAAMCGAALLTSLLCGVCWLPGILPSLDDTHHWQSHRHAHGHTQSIISCQQAYRKLSRHRHRHQPTVVPAVR